MSIVCKSRCGEFERCQFYGLMSDIIASCPEPFRSNPERIGCQTKSVTPRGY
jgi:hypothetical protein